jgi:hypothetical protein
MSSFPSPLRSPTATANAMFQPGTAQMQGIRLNDLYLMQIPHHGSRRNVGLTVLNQIIGKNASVSIGPESVPRSNLINPQNCE